MATEQQAELCCATDDGDSASKRDAAAAMPVAVAVSLCLLHDAVGVALFLASHPLHTVYLLFFARGLLALAAFFWPLLVSTSLLLAVLATVGPYIIVGDWPRGAGVRSSSLGRTCGIAVAALCAELRPDVAVDAPAAAGLVAQLTCFVLGATDDDAASVLRVEEIMGEPACDVITAASCCFVPEEEEEQGLLLFGGDEPAFALPVPVIDNYIGDGTFLDYESFGDLKDRIDEKGVISEDMKGSDPLAEQCCFPRGRDRDTSFVQEMEAEEEEEEESGIQGQDLMLSAIDDEVSDGVEEKRLECDPVSVEIKKSEPVQVLEIRKSQPIQAMEVTELQPLEPMEAKKLEMKEIEPLHGVEIKKCEPMQAVQITKFEPEEEEPPEVKECETVQKVQIRKLQPTLEIKKSEPVESVEQIKKNEPEKPRSLIAQRIKLWEAQVVSGNAKPFVGERDGNSVEFSLKNKPAAKSAKKCVRFVEADPCALKCASDQHAPVLAASTEDCAEQEQEFKDVKECMHPETETSDKCSQDMKAEEITPAVVAHAQAEQELLEQGCNDVQPCEPDLQELEYEIAQPDEQEVEEMEDVYNDVTDSPAMWNERESPLKSTSIAGRVHSRTSSENLVSEGSSPSRKDKEWKRTLACKLYEERMQLRLCRDRAVAVEGSDSNMDMLWEAYEVGSGGGNKARGGGKRKVKGSSTGKVLEETVEEGEEEEEEDEEEEGGSVRQLCCLQALKFSTRKMNFGGGRPSLSKISKVLKRMTALSRMGSSRRKQSE